LPVTNPQHRQKLGGAEGRVIVNCMFAIDCHLPPMSQDQDMGRELSGGTMLRYALVGIGLLGAVIIGKQVIEAFDAIRSMGSGLSAGAEWKNPPVSKRKKNGPYRSGV
jgi:hypothetical protein